MELIYIELALLITSVEDDAVMRARHMASLPKAEDRNYDSLANWMSNQAPLCGTEARFVEHQQDFVALLDPKEGGWFDAFIEDIILPLFPRRMTMVSFVSSRKC